MSLRRFLNFIHWPLSAKLSAIFLLTVLIPALLVIVPVTHYRQGRQLEQDQKERLQTIGTYQRTQPEQSVRLLEARLNTLVATGIDLHALADLVGSTGPVLTTQERAQIEAFIASRIPALMEQAPSISRIRFFTFDGERITDTVAATSTLDSSVPTPADRLLQTDALNAGITTTTIYPVDADRNPGWDVILPLAASQVDTVTPVGYFVFTQNLAVASLDELLPNLYTALSTTPVGGYPTHAFLLAEDGQLVSPAQRVSLFENASTSEGYELAQSGEEQTAIYYSSLLNQEVIGYADSVTVPNGPVFTLLIETPLDSLRRQATEEGLITFILVGSATLLTGLVSILFATVLIARPIARLTESARQIVVGNVGIELPYRSRQDEIGMLSDTLHQMADQLLGAISDLETRIAERTRNLEATLEIGRVLTSLRNLDTLLEEVVNLIRNQFDAIYHAQIFLIDHELDRANLRASTGAAGRQLLQRGHYLNVGSQSVIGSVTATGHAVVALDTSNNPIHQRNEFLPDTRAEMALPLRSGQRIIGALDLQSTEPDAFSEQDVELFQGMADQIAIVIQNATLFEESNARLQEIERLNRSLTETVWREAEYQHGETELTAASGHISTGEEKWSDLQREAIRTRQVAERVEGDQVTFAVPIVLRDQALGAVEWQIPQDRYTRDTRQTAIELTTRLGLTAENIRLFEQSHRAAQREHVVNQISSKLVGTTDIDQILQTAVRELGLALHLPRTTIQLFAPDDVDENG